VWAPVLVTLLLLWVHAYPQPAPRTVADFKRDVRPILEQRCQPCHFPGGQMYQRLPFDRPETIDMLGARLFTRIREEKQREVIRQFLRRTQ
jgi:hypothetical protein